MRVFAVYSGSKAALVRVWAKSWEARGWVPQLLSEREVRQHGNPRRASVARGGGHLTDLCWINFSLTPRRRAQRTVKKFSRPGWESADLVRFPATATEQQVRECGRAL